MCIGHQAELKGVDHQAELKGVDHQVELRGADHQAEINVPGHQAEFKGAGHQAELKDRGLRVELLSLQAMLEDKGGLPAEYQVLPAMLTDPQAELMETGHPVGHQAE